MIVRRAIRALVSVAVALPAVLLVTATPAMAEDRRGHFPSWEWDCGAMRDIPSQWKVVSDSLPCNSTFSYIWTSPTTVHYATWTFGAVTSDDGTFEIDAWIPNTGASQLVQYDFQMCGSSSWAKLGTLNQNYDDSDDNQTWYVVGYLSIQADQGVCAIRMHNIGGASWDEAEDALGLYRVTG